MRPGLRPIEPCGLGSREVLLSLTQRTTETKGVGLSPQTMAGPRVWVMTEVGHSATTFGFAQRTRPTMVSSESCVILPGQGG